MNDFESLHLDPKPKQNLSPFLREAVERVRERALADNKDPDVATQDFLAAVERDRKNATASRIRAEDKRTNERIHSTERDIEQLSKLSDADIQKLYRHIADTYENGGKKQGPEELVN